MLVKPGEELPKKQKGRCKLKLFILFINSLFLNFALCSDMRLSENPVLHLGEHLGESFVFQKLVSVATTPDGTLYVLDSGQATIFKYDMNGWPLGKLGNPGQGPGEFFNPSSVAVVGPYLWVADFGNGRVQIFKDDIFLKTIKVQNPNMPKNLAISNGKVYVAAQSLVPEFGSMAVFNPSGTQHSEVALNATSQTNRRVASLWNMFHLTPLSDDRLILGFRYDNVVSVMDHHGKIVNEERMELYDHYENKVNGRIFPAGYSAMAFSEGPEESILIAVCNQETRTCGKVYRFDGQLKNALQKWDLGGSVRFMKYERELGLLVTVRTAEVLVYAVD